MIGCEQYERFPRSARRLREQRGNRTWNLEHHLPEYVLHTWSLDPLHSFIPLLNSLFLIYELLERPLAISFAGPLVHVLVQFHRFLQIRCLVNEKPVLSNYTSELFPKRIWWDTLRFPNISLHHENKILHFRLSHKVLLPRVPAIQDRLFQILNSLPFDKIIKYVRRTRVSFACPSGENRIPTLQDLCLLEQMRGSRLRYLADLSSASKSQHGYADSHLDQHFTSASYRNATLEVVSAATTSVDLSIVNDQQEFTASIIVLDERAKWLGILKTIKRSHHAILRIVGYG